MSSKRQRGESSRSRASFDQSKFVSKEASDRFHKILVKKTFVLERGLRPNPQLDGDMAVMIAERNWSRLVEQPGPAVIPVVKEFYANAIERVGHVVQVRGKSVAFDSAAINAYFNIEDVNSANSYEDFIPGLDSLIQHLCQPGTPWTLKINTNEKISFPHSALSKYGKAWYAFICANLMPTRHQNDVTKERAKLLYGIVHRFFVGENDSRIYDVDIGMVIQQSIEKFIKGGTTGGLPHGSLITALCQQAGVHWQSSEPMQHPMAIIDHLTIEKYREWEGGISHPRGEGYIMRPPPPQPDHVPPNSHSDAANSSFNVSGPSGVDQFGTMMRSMHRRLDRLADRQDNMYAYMGSFNTAMLNEFARLNPGADVSHFPTPTPLSAYPPSDDDDV